MNLKSVGKMCIAFFIITMLILTTTLGLVAIKQQQLAEVLPKKEQSGTYLFLPFDINCVNPSEQTQNNLQLKKLLEAAMVLTVLIVFKEICVKFFEKQSSTDFFGEIKNEKVVLLE